MPPKGNVGHVKPQSTHDQSHRKAEALLNAAERGSIPHLERLQLEWPADTSLAQRAMTILLGNLKAEAHHIPRLESQAPDKELQRSLDIALASLAGLNGALGPLDSGPEMQAKQIVATFHPYLEYYLAWLRFTLVKSHLAMPPQPISPGLQAATRLGTLMEVGMHMTEDPEILERIVDLSLLIFTADSQPVAIFTQEQYDTLVAPKLNPLGLCLRPNTPTREALYNKLSSWNTRSLKRLFEVFHREFLECSAGIPKNTPGVNCTTLSSYVFFTLSLSSRLPRFCKIMMKSGFPTLAMKAALDVRLAPARNLPRGPMSLEISTVLFNRQILLVDYSRRLVTQVLKAGILEIIVDDLLAPRDKGEVFDEWKFDEYVGHPLGALLCASYDRHIANALNTAIMSLSPTTTRDIALNDSARRIWGPFLHDFQLHQAALRQLSDDRIPICDSLLHHAVTKAGALQDTPKECSTCRTTVYCSIDCQREDWDALHRYECTRRRVELIAAKTSYWIARHIHNSNDRRHPRRKVENATNSIPFQGRSAERGSISHLRRLEKEWPTDTSLAERALTILLQNFKAEVHHLQRLQTQVPDTELQRVLDLMLASLAGLDGAFKFLDHAPETQANQVAIAFHPYLREFFAWFRFFMVNPRLAIPDEPMMTGSQAATRMAVLLKAGVYMTDNPEILDHILDMSLFIFMDTTPWRWQKDKTLPQAQYDKIVAPKFEPLGMCLHYTSTREALFRKLNSSTTEALKRLCDTFSRECSESSAGLPKDSPELDCTTFSSYVYTALTFCSQVPRFFKIMLKTRFPVLALQGALSVRHAKDSRIPMGSISLEIATSMFNTEILLIDNSRRLIVQLLEAGILEVVIGDLLYPRDEEEDGELFEEWRFQGDMNPLKALLYACYDRRIATALNTAIMSVSSSTKRDISMNGTAREIWGAFVRDFQFYQDALCRFPNDRIPLCDSLMHHSTTKPHELGDAPKECAMCQTTVYCSTKCQGEDWNSLHREECTRNRVDLTAN
ncbi:hypothetical protein D9611_005876 [Ephemerocybe angulata]|uniref:phytol kinase n=1 Tax=Ephemerocybe angulata TaxID=980116 RepID=A0A8H5FLV2_9AGAR|nr:hypothetical protein D9611_005876 [Tulosesus angulatus]